MTVLDSPEMDAFRLRPARITIRELHGPWDENGACWPSPYAHPIDSAAMAAALSEAPRSGATERWEHGTLVEVTSAERLERLRDSWGARRTSGARVGPLTEVPISTRDREAMARFCERGWLRMLVQAFAHVGAKAAHVGRLDEGLRAFGTLGAAILEARTRHRLAVLEELLQSRGGDAGQLFSELDKLDQALDEDLGRSWLMERLPDHCASLWPMRNLMRLADRQGVLLRDIPWQDYEDESSYAPELPVLSLEPRIYGAGVEHDITHYLEPVFWTDDQLLFEVANNGIEGDGQAMNNLILSCRYSGPVYEGYAGWPGGQLFEWLERAFGVATFPQMFGALRTFTIVLHERFEGDRVATLRRLIPSLVEGPHLEDLLAFFPEYVQHDHGFLGALHSRYVTPFYDDWREQVADRLTFELEEHVGMADDFLWEHQDVDLRTWWHPGVGRWGALKARIRFLWTRCLELNHLAQNEPAYDAFREETQAEHLACRVLDERAQGPSGSLVLGLCAVPPGERSPDQASAIDHELDELTASLEAIHERVAALAERMRAAPKGNIKIDVTIPTEFPDNFVDLFAGFYYQAPRHIGSDLEPSGVTLDGARLGRP